MTKLGDEIKLRIEEKEALLKDLRQSYDDADANNVHLHARIASKISDALEELRGLKFMSHLASADAGEDVSKS